MKSLPLPTVSAHWGWDEHRYFGHRVFAELAGRESLTGLTALSVLGRRLSAADCAVLDAAAACLTLADPRIWPLKLTRVVASYGGTLAGVAAGLLIEEDARIGPWTCAKSAELLVDLHRRIVASGGSEAAVRGAVLPYLADHHFVWGFGTPFRSRDERLVAFRACLERQGRVDLPYFRTFEAVAKVIVPARETEPNMGMGIAAACLDLGVQAPQVGALATALMQHMFFAHGVEGAQQAPEVLRRLPDAYLHYKGRAARQSPRAAAELGAEAAE